MSWGVQQFFSTSADAGPRSSRSGPWSTDCAMASTTGRSMAVVVQQMVFPRAAGVLFTADPVTGNRKVAAVEASLGLGEALVSGVTNADVYKVRDGQIIAKTIAVKQCAISASPA